MYRQVRSSIHLHALRICRHVVAAFVRLTYNTTSETSAACSSCILPHVPKSPATTNATNVVVILLFVALEWHYTNHD